MDTRDARAPVFFVFMQFVRKIVQNIRLKPETLRLASPSSGEYWVCHCIITSIRRMGKVILFTGVYLFSGLWSRALSWGRGRVPPGPWYLVLSEGTPVRPVTRGYLLSGETISQTLPFVHPVRAYKFRNSIFRNPPWGIQIHKCLISRTPLYNSYLDFAKVKMNFYRCCCTFFTDSVPKESVTFTTLFPKRVCKFYQSVC